MVNQVIVETSLITFGTFGRGFNLLDLSDNGGRSHKSAKADLQDLPQHANCTFSTRPDHIRLGGLPYENFMVYHFSVILAKAGIHAKTGFPIKSEMTQAKFVL